MEEKKKIIMGLSERMEIALKEIEGSPKGLSVLGKNKVFVPIGQSTSAITEFLASRGVRYEIIPEYGRGVIVKVPSGQLEMALCQRPPT